jgi:hypothetical protein
MSIERLEWDPELGAEHIRAGLERDGVVWLSAPDLVQSDLHPRVLAQRLLGNALEVGWLEADEITPREPSFRIASSRGSGPAHIDDAPNLAAQLLVMCCQQPAESGGECLFVDTWPILDAIAAADPDFYDALFEVRRPLITTSFNTWRPTFSYRHGALTCAHPPMLLDDDAVGVRFREHVRNAEQIEIVPVSGDVMVANNHRMLHGRRGFTGARRFLRLLIWTESLLPAPPQHLGHARRAAGRWSADVAGQPDWVRTLLAGSDGVGMRRLAAVMERLAGDSPDEIVERHGCLPEDLRWWIDRVLTAALAALESDDEPEDLDNYLGGLADVPSEAAAG